MKYSGVSGWGSVDDSATTVLADTGWYDPYTMLDVPDPTQDVPAARYRFVLGNKGKDDYNILSDHRSQCTPFLTTDKRGNFVRDTRKPYWDTSRWAQHPIYGASFMIDRDTKSKYLHPRFTEFKNQIRQLEKYLKANARKAQRTYARNLPKRKVPA